MGANTHRRADGARLWKVSAIKPQAPVLAHRRAVCVMINSGCWPGRDRRAFTHTHAHTHGSGQTSPRFGVYYSPANLPILPLYPSIPVFMYRRIIIIKHALWELEQKCTLVQFFQLFFVEHNLLFKNCCCNHRNLYSLFINVSFYCRIICFKFVKLKRGQNSNWENEWSKFDIFPNRSPAARCRVQDRDTDCD